jgi:hypothetical protein
MVNIQSKDGWSASITGIESNAGVKGAVFSALSMASLNLRKDKNYTLLIDSDGHGNIRISTDAPKDVIEPELAKIREATARGDEYHGNVSPLTPERLTEYTLEGLNDSNVKSSVRGSLWRKDMRAGGKNQQFSGVSAGINGAGIAHALVRSDDAENNAYLSNVFSGADTRQQENDRLSAFAKAMKAASDKDKEANQETIFEGKIRDMSARLAVTTDPKEARKLRRGLKRERSKIQKAARRKALHDPSSPLFRDKVYNQRQAVYAAWEVQEQAKQDFIKANPTSIIAYEEVAKQQKINNRADKARLLEAERTPGTPEFQARVQRGLDKRIAQDKVAVEWAKKNRDKPLAKAILKQNRRKTRTGRALEKAGAAARATVTGAVISGILGAVSTAVKFLSQLPAIAENVHRVAIKGQTYNMTEQKVREYEAIEKSARLDSGAFSSVFGGMVSTLSDIVTGGMPDTISKVVTFLSIAGQSPIDAIVKYTTGTDKDVEKLFREMFNSALRISFQGKDTTHRSGGLSFSAALAENAQVMEKAFPGMGGILHGFGNAAEKYLTKTQLEEAKNSGDIFGYLVNALGESASISAQTATNVEHHEADRVAGVFTNVATVLTNIKDGILTQILAALEPLASWLMVIAKGILANPVFDGRFDSLVSSLDAADNEKNVAALAANEIYLKTLEASVPALAAKLGYATPEQRQDIVHRFERFGEIPSSVFTQEQFDEFFNYIGQEQSLKVARETNKKLNYEIDKFTTGSAESLTKPGKIDRYEIGSTVTVPNVTAAQVGIKASNYLQTTAFDIALEADRILAENGPMSTEALRQRSMEIERVREEKKKYLETHNHTRYYYRKNTPEEIEAALQVYDNEHARELAAIRLLYSLGRDGTPARPGETRTSLNTLSRREQREITTELTAIEAIRAQVPQLFENILKGIIRVEGGPSEGKREYVIRLIDTRTGKEHVIRDVYNVGGGTQSLRGSNIDLEALLGGFSPTPFN